MSRDERRKDRDPVWWQQVRARLARIRVAQAAKRTQELAGEWPQDNVIEAVILRRRLKGNGGDGSSPTRG